LFLGFSQWRRQRIIGLYEHFPELGVVVHIPSDYSDYLWQRRPTSAEVHLKGSRWGWDRLDVEPYNLGELHRKLRRVGIDDIRHFVDVAGNMPEVISQDDMDGIDWSKPNAIDVQEERIFGKNW
jgi:hypothetical protein